MYKRQIEDSTNGIIAAKEGNFFCVAYKSKNSKDQDYSRADLLISDYNTIKYDKVKDLFTST